MNVFLKPKVAHFVIFFCFFFLPLFPPLICCSYPVESSSGGLPAKVRKSRSTLSNGSIKKVDARKALSLEAAQLEIQQQHKTLTRQAPVRWASWGHSSNYTKAKNVDSVTVNNSLIQILESDTRFVILSLYTATEE